VASFGSSVSVGNSRELVRSLPANTSRFFFRGGGASVNFVPVLQQRYTMWSLGSCDSQRRVGSALQRILHRVFALFSMRAPDFGH
jgi:hypothetical protein